MGFWTSGLALISGRNGGCSSLFNLKGVTLDSEQSPSFSASFQSDAYVYPSAYIVYNNIGMDGKQFSAGTVQLYFCGTFDQQGIIDYINAWNNAQLQVPNTYGFWNGWAWDTGVNGPYHNFVLYGIDGSVRTISDIPQNVVSMGFMVVSSFPFTFDGVNTITAIPFTPPPPTAADVIVSSPSGKVMTGVLSLDDYANAPTSYVYVSGGQAYNIFSYISINSRVFSTPTITLNDVISFIGNNLNGPIPIISSPSPSASMSIVISATPSGSDILLSWNPINDTTRTYQINEGTDPSNLSPRASISNTQSSFLDTPADTNPRYYQIVSTDNAVQSNIISASTRIITSPPSTAPPATPPISITPTPKPATIKSSLPIIIGVIALGGLLVALGSRKSKSS